MLSKASRIIAPIKSVGRRNVDDRGPKNRRFIFAPRSRNYTFVGAFAGAPLVLPAVSGSRKRQPPAPRERWG
jgi:hypothetical protein